MIDLQYNPQTSHLFEGALKCAYKAFANISDRGEDDDDKPAGGVFITNLSIFFIILTIFIY
jgi:hypothetical protein